MIEKDKPQVDQKESTDLITENTNNVKDISLITTEEDRLEVGKKDLANSIIDEDEMEGSPEHYTYNMTNENELKPNKEKETSELIVDEVQPNKEKEPNDLIVSEDEIQPNKEKEPSDLIVDEDEIQLNNEKEPTNDLIFDENELKLNIEKEPSDLIIDEDEFQPNDEKEPVDIIVDEDNIKDDKDKPSEDVIDIHKPETDETDSAIKITEDENMEVNVEEVSDITTEIDQLNTNLKNIPPVKKENYYIENQHAKGELSLRIKIKTDKNDTNAHDSSSDRLADKTQSRKKKRNNVRKSWSKAELEPAPKKAKGGLRADCPAFCRQGCTRTHHPLLVYARRVIENDSATTMVFLEHVSDYYEGKLSVMTPSECIDDPWKNTSFPLLHYLALMGKCAGCFALIDAGHSPITTITENGDTVLHTLIKEMYNFNCTHGHMDILLKKFNLLLKEFKDCLFITNSDLDTPLHICARMIRNTSKLLNISGRSKPPFRLYQYLKNMFSSCITQIMCEDDLTKLDLQNNEGYTLAHYLAEDRASDYLLSDLEEKGCDFNLLTKNNESVLQIKLTAPPAPPEGVLDLAKCSEVGHKYKSSPSKRMKFSTLSRRSKLEKSLEKAPATMVTEVATSMVTKVSTVQNKIAIHSLCNKTKLKKSKIAEKLNVPIKPNSSIIKVKVEREDESVKVNGDVNRLKSKYTPASASMQGNKLATFLTGLVTPNATIKTPNCGIKVTNQTKLPANVVKLDKLSLISGKPVDISAMQIVGTTTNVTPIRATKLHIDSLPSMVSSQTTVESNLPPANILSQAVSRGNFSYPIISNVQSVNKTPNSKPLFIFRPHLPQMAQRPLMSIPPNKVLNSQIFQPVISPGSSTQHHRPQISMANKVMNSPGYQPNNIQQQQPVYIRTSDGRLMPVNVITNTKENVNNINKILLPKAFGASNANQMSSYQGSAMLPRLIQNQLGRFVISPRNVAQPNFRPQTILPNYNGIHIQPTSPPVVLPTALMNRSPTLPNNVNMFHIASPLSPPVTTINVLQPRNTNLKHNTDQKSKNLEASIKNLHHSVVAASSLNRPLAAIDCELLESMRRASDTAPPVIILDNDDMGQVNLSTSPQKHGETTRVASLVKQYLKEKGSVTDFLKFSEEKKEHLVEKLNTERKRIIEMNDSILTKENEVKTTREFIVKKEMEIAQLRLKLTHMQSSVGMLRSKRSDVVNSCNSLEKRIKAVEERTEIFQTLTYEGRII